MFNKQQCNVKSKNPIYHVLGLKYPASIRHKYYIGIKYYRPAAAALAATGELTIEGDVLHISTTTFWREYNV